MKFFNTAGPVNQSEHYKIDPLTRWDLEEILSLIEQKKYFILHAPRQTGKTSCLLALRDCLNAEGLYHCVYANFEMAQTSRNNILDGMRVLLSELHERAVSVLGRELPFSFREFVSESEGAGKALNSYLFELCKEIDRPLVLLVIKSDRQYFMEEIKSDRLYFMDRRGGLVYKGVVFG
jgi:hypothetical protein